MILHGNAIVIINIKLYNFKSLCCDNILAMRCCCELVYFRASVVLIIPYTSLSLITLRFRDGVWQIFLNSVFSSDTIISKEDKALTKHMHSLKSCGSKNYFSSFQEKTGKTFGIT